MLERCGIRIEDVDLLFLDTEGHDAVILDQLMAMHRWPDAVLYEHKHLTSDTRDQCIARFRDAGYDISVFTSDVFATRRSQGTIQSRT